MLIFFFVVKHIVLKYDARLGMGSFIIKTRPFKQVISFDGLLLFFSRPLYNFVVVAGRHRCFVSGFERSAVQKLRNYIFVFFTTPLINNSVIPLYYILTFKLISNLRNIIK